MFQSLRPSNPLYVLDKDKTTLDVGSIVSVSVPVPKYQIPNYGRPQEMVVDVVAKINNQDITFQKIPAALDIADTNNIVISDSREAMSSEVTSLKNKSSEILKSINYHKNVITNCEKILTDLNPEYAEKQAQRKELDDLKSQVQSISSNLKELISKLNK